MSLSTKCGKANSNVKFTLLTGQNAKIQQLESCTATVGNVNITGNVLSAVAPETTIEIQGLIIPPCVYSQGTVQFNPPPGLPSWSGQGFVQRCGEIGHLDLAAYAGLPFGALNPVVALIPAAFAPSQDMLAVPYATEINGALSQIGTLDILTTGEVTNLSTGFDQVQLEHFHISVLLPLTPT